MLRTCIQIMWERFFKILVCISEILKHDNTGQASVEIALLFGSVSFCIALVLQPICLLYTKSIMISAAREVARAAYTHTDSAGSLEAYARRRLSVIPDIALLHIGGEETWDINVTVSPDSREVQVVIRGKSRLLPLLGMSGAFMGRVDGGDIELEVSVSEVLKPTWLGGEYAQWISMWNTT